jgi:hypothetical protein
MLVGNKHGSDTNTIRRIQDTLRRYQIQPGRLLNHYRDTTLDQTLAKIWRLGWMRRHNDGVNIQSIEMRSYKKSTPPCKLRRGRTFGQKDTRDLRISCC